MTFSPFVRTLVWTAQNGICKLCEKKMTEAHHRVPNTKTNNKMFPLFLHSIFNCVGLCQGCHANRKSEVSITEDEAIAYEEYLRMVERVAKESVQKTSRG